MKKSVKMFTVMLLALLMICAAVSCTQQNNEPEEVETASVEPENTEEPGEDTPEEPVATADAYTPKLVGYAQSRMSHPYRVNAIKEFEETIKELELPWEYIVTDGNNDVATQMQNIEDLLAKGVDAIIMTPSVAEPLVSAAQMVKDAGIPIIMCNRYVSDENAYDVYCGAPNYDLGVFAAEDIGTKLEGKGKVLMIEGTLGSSDTLERAAGFTETLAAKYPDVELLQTQSGDYQQDEAMKVMEDYLTKYSEIDAVFCHNDTMAFGAVAAIEAQGREGEGIMVYGADGQTDAFKLIEEGKMEGCVVYPSSSRLAVETLVDIFNNGGKYEGEKWIKDQVYLVTAENVDQYEGF